MMKTMKKAVKVGAGIMFVTALTSAAAGYFFAKRGEYAREGDFEEDDGEEIAGPAMSRKTALKDIVKSGLVMKRVWNRIQRDVKIITDQTGERLIDDEDSDEDDDQ